MEKEIVLNVSNDGLAIIIINRPQTRNALNWAAQEQFAQIVEGLHGSPELRVVIIAAAGDAAFVSGGDVKEMAQDQDPAAGKRMTMIMGAALESLTNLPVPVIGAANGNAVGGGCEILTACDLRLSAADVRFRFAEVRMALSTGWGGTARLVRLIGLSRALDLLLTGREFDAQEALDIGFINRVVSVDDDILKEAKRWARELVVLPKNALAAAKELAWTSSNLTISDVRELEIKHFRQLWLQADHIEAMKAFTEKRPPRFNNDVD